MFELKFWYFFVYKTIVTMSRRSDLNNLRDKEIHDLLWEQEELPVDTTALTSSRFTTAVGASLFELS